MSLASIVSDLISEETHLVDCIPQYSSYWKYSSCCVVI